MESTPNPDDAPESPASQPLKPITYRSQDLLQGRREMWFEHVDEKYRLLVAAAVLYFGLTAGAADEPAKSDARACEQSIVRAIEYLRSKGQAVDGSYSAAAGPDVTALVTTAILKPPCERGWDSCPN